MFGALDVSASALVANRVRMDTIAGNLANVYTTLGPDRAYERRVPMFTLGQSPDNTAAPGVHVSEIAIDSRPGRLVHMPGHPHAIQDGANAGMVRLPNVDPLEEMVNGMLAARAYEANITVMGATRGMMNAALRMIA